MERSGMYNITVRQSVIKKPLRFPQEWHVSDPTLVMFRPGEKERFIPCLLYTSPRREKRVASERKEIG